MIPANPAAGVGRSLKLNAKPGDGHDGEVAAFDRDQLQAFELATPERYGPVFLFMARTGCRVGEALAVQWADLDLSGRTARISRTLSRGKLGTPKGNRARTVDLSRSLVECLRHLKAIRAQAALKSGKPMAPWCFTTSTGGPLDASRLRKVFVRILKAAKLPRHHNPKSLRHTFASIMLAEGESPVWVQQQLGHASLDLTTRVYGRWLRKRPIAGGVDRLDSPGSNVVSLAAVAGGNGKSHGQIERRDLKATGSAVAPSCSSICVGTGWTS